jgi:hypothetical protein
MKATAEKTKKTHGNTITMAERWARARRYEEALRKIHRLPTTGTRARNVAAKALNGHLSEKI